MSAPPAGSYPFGGQSELQDHRRGQSATLVNRTSSDAVSDKQLSPYAAGQLGEPERQVHRMIRSPVGTPQTRLCPQRGCETVRLPVGISGFLHSNRQLVTPCNSWYRGTNLSIVGHGRWRNLTPRK